MSTENKHNNFKVHAMKCTVCGKFISYREYFANRVIIDFIPDTHFTSEKIVYKHISCVKKIDNAKI